MEMQENSCKSGNSRRFRRIQQNLGKSRKIHGNARKFVKFRKFEENQENFENSWKCKEIRENRDI
jgi:hypothetical protein